MTFSFCRKIKFCVVGSFSLEKFFGVKDEEIFLSRFLLLKKFIFVKKANDSSTKNFLSGKKTGVARFEGSFAK